MRDNTKRETETHMGNVVFCPQCGARARWYDGALGYEAILCEACHTLTNANPPHDTEPWARFELFELNAGVSPSSKDHDIITNSIIEFDKIAGPRVGDYIDFPDGKTRRFTHHWGTDIQTTMPGCDSSFYFEGGTISFSGSLDRGIPIEQIEAIAETRNGNVWFFHDNWRQAHSAVGARIPFRVFRLKA